MSKYKLPPLPEGYFWRVRENWEGGFHVDMRRKRRFGSRLVARESLYFPTHGSILSAAEAIISSMNIQRTAEELLGDYPPNRLDK